jgi:hypothetical protein
MFSPQQNRKTRGGTGSAHKGEWGGEVAQIMYTYVSKCNNDKINKCM